MATVLPSKNPRSLLALVFGDKPKHAEPAPASEEAKAPVARRAKKKPAAKKAAKKKGK